MQEIIRLKFARWGVRGRTLTLFVRFSQAAFFLFAIIVILSSITLFGAGMRNGNPTLRSLLGFIPLPIIIFVYAFIMANVPKSEAEEGIEIRKRMPNKNELALGFAFGKEEEKQVHQLKGISQEDRQVHMHVIGGSKTGKSKFLESIIQQDIEASRGFAVIDPHGDLIEAVKGLVALHNSQNDGFLQKNVGYT